MKIISLNTWGGRAGKEKLLGFFRKHADKVDVFCLQEIWSAPYEDLDGQNAGSLKIDHEKIMVHGLQEIAAVLPQYDVYFHPHHQDNYGLMMAVKKSLDVFDVGDIFVHKHRGYIPEGNIGEHARNIQYVSFNSDHGPLTVINFHGLWTSNPQGTGKQDIPDRLEQSDNIVKFIRTIEHPIVFCGDFNLLPTTESIKKFEDAGLKNLIKEYGITSTRTSYYPRSEQYADYAFVSPELEVNDFNVLPDEVSDHAPLLIDIA
ncbi:MAG: endonuclease/exonuclease/phosphatase family protein [Patescibacteria group bacterium UBA2163]